jgi:hypothetical protein
MHYGHCEGSEEVRALHLAWLWLRSVLLEERIPTRWYRHRVGVAFGMGIFRDQHCFVLVRIALDERGGSQPYCMRVARPGRMFRRAR